MGAPTVTRCGLLFAPILALTLASCGAGPGRVPDGPGQTEAPARAVPEAVDRRVVELAERDLWPGFDPRTVPLLIHDGERTWLFRHPAPPDGFRPIDGAHVMDGRHPTAIANTSAEIGGVQTAILWERALDRPADAAAATAIHEAFHAFQRVHHPGWIANEMDFFVYPVDDVEALALRRLESEALRRALRAPDRSAAACWARVALDLRERRFRRLPATAAAYEQGNELNEGLARYVEWRALDAPPPPDDFDVFPADAVRLRTYAVGAALASLLDRLDGDWRKRLAGDPDLSLDRLLAAVVPEPPSDRACALDAAEQDRARDAASHDVARLERERAEARRDFLDAPGWRLVLEAAAAPFNLRFDPLNLQVAGPGEILHHRIALLQGTAGSVEVSGRPALTTGAGEHPLFHGVASLIVTGLPDRPEIRTEDGLSIRADGLSLQLDNATVEVADGVVTVRVTAAPR
jgi:hypothetical protein